MSVFLLPPTLALSSCSCAWRSASRRYASRSSSADRSESDGLLVYESADPCWNRSGGVGDQGVWRGGGGKGRGRGGVEGGVTV